MKRPYKIYYFYVLPIIVFCAIIFGISTYFLLDKQMYKLNIPRLTSNIDKDSDGVDDFTDAVQSARAQIGVVTSYDTSYYSNGGYPPDDRGACADVIWRTFDDVGYDIKSLLEADIKTYPERYDEVNLADANINFRRTQNLRTFFKYNTQELTNEIKPDNVDNLTQWQGGDIVTFAQIPGGLWHIAIVSDKRRADGVPLLIHNHGYGVMENDFLLTWPSQITGHFRLKIKNTV